MKLTKIKRKNRHVFVYKPEIKPLYMYAPHEPRAYISDDDGEMIWCSPERPYILHDTDTSIDKICSFEEIREIFGYQNAILADKDQFDNYLNIHTDCFLSISIINPSAGWMSREDNLFSIFDSEGNFLEQITKESFLEDYIIMYPTTIKEAEVSA